MNEPTERNERERVRKMARRRRMKLTTAKNCAHRYALLSDDYGHCGTFRTLADVVAELHARKDMASTTQIADVTSEVHRRAA